MAGLLRPGGEVARFTERFGMMVTGFKCEPYPKWYGERVPSNPDSCRKAIQDVMQMDAHEQTSLCYSLRAALATARVPGTATTAVGTETLADCVYLLSDGHCYDSVAVEVRPLL
eukprot:7824462-Pyramimonas_sp.AAC.2